MPRPPRRHRWGRPSGLALVLLLVVWGMLGLGRHYQRLLEEDRAALDQHLARQGGMLARVPLLSAAEQAALRRPAYAEHVALGERLGVMPASTRSGLRAGAADSGLVQLADTDGYWIAPARYSVPHATPDAAAALDSIAARFGAALVQRRLPRFTVVVTSVLRSDEDQEDLRQVNANAARGRSSHTFGVSFDLAYRRFVPVLDTALVPPVPRVPPVLRGLARARRRARLEEHGAALAAAYPARLDALLGRTLLALKADSVLVVLRERRQPVYHVTVARRLAPDRAAP